MGERILDTEISNISTITTIGYQYDGLTEDDRLVNRVLKEHYNKMYQENLSHADPMAYIRSKYCDVTSPNFCSYMTEDQRHTAYLNEKRMLQTGGKHTAGFGRYDYALRNYDGIYTGGSKEIGYQRNTDKVEISKDSPEYETICSQMRSMESYGAIGLGNQLFYDSYEIMYDYYDGKLTEEDVKKFFKDYLYNSVGEVEENNIYQQKSVTANLSRIYEMFTRGNMQNAVNQNQKEGQNFLKEHGLDGHNEFYYNAKWYWKSEDMQQLFQETANEIAEEYGAEKVDFESVIENTNYTLAGGMTFNGVWNWMNWQTNRPSPLGNDNYLEEDFVPPEDFIYCTGNSYATNSNKGITEEDIKEVAEKETLISIFLSIYMQNSSNTTSSLFLNKNNWGDVEAEETVYTKMTDILKQFHIEYFTNNRFECLWMGNED